MSTKSPRQIKLLVSVRNATEAVAALEGGADIIDVKEPKHGPLGMAEPRVMSEVVDAVDGRVPVSVAMGELRDNPSMASIPKGVAFAKIGLSGVGPRWRQQLTRKFGQAPKNIRPIAVAYFNASNRAYPPVTEDVVRWAIENRVAGVLFDTYMKDRGNLFETRRSYLIPKDILEDLCTEQVLEYVEFVQAAGLLMALAGSLSGAALETALAMEPDIIGVRGAVCVDGKRKQAIDARLVRNLADLIAAHNALPAASAG